MKQDAILKINKMGKAGTIITNIAKVFIIATLIFVFLLTVAFAFVPKDFFTARAESRLFVNVSLASFGKSLTDEEVEQSRQETQKILEEEGADAGGSEYSIDAMNVNNDNISVDLSGRYVDFSLHNLVWVMLFTFLYLAMTLTTLFFIGFLCKAFQNCESPFEQNVIKKMKTLAYSLIPWAILSTVSGAVTRIFLKDGIHMGDFGIDLRVVMTVLIILALAYIFQYGAILQQESDETL